MRHRMRPVIKRLERAEAVAMAAGSVLKAMHKAFAGHLGPNEQRAVLHAIEDCDNLAAARALRMAAAKAAREAQQAPNDQPEAQALGAQTEATGMALLGRAS